MSRTLVKYQKLQTANIVATLVLVAVAATALGFGIAGYIHANDAETLLTILETIHNTDIANITAKHNADIDDIIANYNTTITNIITNYNTEISNINETIHADVLLDLYEVHVPDGGSLQDAIASIPDITAIECIVHIDGSVDMGVDPVICLFPIVTRCKHIKIMGVRENVVEDTVQSIGEFNTITGWNVITGINGGYPLEVSHIENTKQNIVYVIDNNTASTIDVLSSDDSDVKLFEHVDLPFDVNQTLSKHTNHWSIGDSFSLFTLSSALAWEGHLVIDIPFSAITFENIILSPNMTITEQTVITGGIDRNLIFRGCRLNVHDSRLLFGGVSSSIIMQGVAVHNAGSGVAEMQFSSTNKGLSILSVSLEGGYFTVFPYGNPNIRNLKGLTTYIFLGYQGDISDIGSLANTQHDILFVGPSISGVFVSSCDMNAVAIDGTTVKFTNNLRITAEFSPALTCAGCRIILPTNPIALSSPVGQPAIQMGAGSTIYTTQVIFNNGAGFALKCGNIPDTAVWLASENDLVNNVFCTKK